MLRPRPLHINWFAFDEVQFTIWQGRTNFTSDSRQHFSNVSENLCFGHLTDGNPSYDFRSPAISARTDVFLSHIWFCEFSLERSSRKHSCRMVYVAFTLSASFCSALVFCGSQTATIPP